MNFFVSSNCAQGTYYFHILQTRVTKSKFNGVKLNYITQNPKDFLNGTLPIVCCVHKPTISWANAPNKKKLSSPTSSRISTLAPSSVLIERQPFIGNFTLLVPLASSHVVLHNTCTIYTT